MHDFFTHSLFILFTFWASLKTDDRELLLLRDYFTDSPFTLFTFLDKGLIGFFA